MEMIHIPSRSMILMATDSLLFLSIPLNTCKACTLSGILSRDNGGNAPPQMNPCQCGLEIRAGNE